METLPSKYILTIKPKEYLVQGLTHCGAFSIKAILSALGKDNNEDPKDYHANFFNHLVGFSMGKSYWPNIFKKNGLDAEIKTAKSLSNSEKISCLRSLLAQNLPVMIRIGNGYFRSKTYNPIIGKLMTHWITLWGYDDMKKVFYIYDSGLSEDQFDKGVPIGNTKRTYDEILRDWNFGFWQFWAWFVSPDNYVYIKLKGDD